MILIGYEAGSVSLRGGVAAPHGRALTARDRAGTMAYQVLAAHDRAGAADRFAIRFDGLISHDITYVGIIQTARASGMTRFSLPYVLTNCHNSLCAVGGTINEDDHVFGLSAARKYGGDYVPANLAVIHQYAREAVAKSGGMVLGSDSHTRYGALGALGVGEGGPELVKQLLGNTWDIAAPRVVLVRLTGAPRPGVGPHDVALALCEATYQDGLVKNCILEFVGDGVANLSMDERLGIDVMTTETACLSSIWQTDEITRDYFARHGRAADYQPMNPLPDACYDAMISIDLSAIEPMIALPFHPSLALPIRSFKADAGDHLREAELRAGAAYAGHLTKRLRHGELIVDQGVIAGCAGGLYGNIAEAAQILRGNDCGDGYFSLSVYPPSVPVYTALMRDGYLEALTNSGALIKSCFCGPCFGAGDVPANDAFSIRHTTRNFPHREGSRPGDGQISWVALMDARSIAATARNHGALTAATELSYPAVPSKTYAFDAAPYRARVYHGCGAPMPDEALRFGPNIADWPTIPAMPKHLLLRVASVLRDPVTTTDELIPSGETSSYRSNPLKLASFALSRRDPDYVGRAQATQRAEAARAAGDCPADWAAALPDGIERADTGFASVLYAHHPGDGSAREQAASCQRVLGGAANICLSYATKRYRSNLINWGMLPLTAAEDPGLAVGDFLFLRDIAGALRDGREQVEAAVIRDGDTRTLTLSLAGLTEEDRQILLDGCLMNHYAKQSR